MFKEFVIAGEIEYCTGDSGTSLDPPTLLATRETQDEANELAQRLADLATNDEPITREETFPCYIVWLNVLGRTPEGRYIVLDAPVFAGRFDDILQASAQLLLDQQLVSRFEPLVHWQLEPRHGW